MTKLREAALAETARLTGAGPGVRVIVACAGSTAGLNRIAGLLDLIGLIARGRRVGVLTGSCEHHSNILPWRETGAEVIEIDEAPGDGVDMDHLARVLQDERSANLVVGTFSAASHVTGILTDADAVTRLLRPMGRWRSGITDARALIARWT